MRVSFGKEYIIIRLSSRYTKHEMLHHIERSKNWALSQIKKNPSLLNRYHTRDYDQNPELIVMEEKLVVHLEELPRQNGKASINGAEIIVSIPEDMESFERQKMIRTLLSRVIGKSFKKRIEQRVDELNDLHFQKDIKGISLKYNVTNWGSCSSNNNINLSTRLLLAPLWVIDYVIIHELAHLEEMNHSDRFWSIVERADPDYQSAERWLKKEGKFCYF